MLLAPETVQAVALEFGHCQGAGEAWDKLAGKSDKTGLWEQLFSARENTEQA